MGPGPFAIYAGNRANREWINVRIVVKDALRGGEVTETDCPIHGKIGGEDGDCPRC